MDTLNNPEGPKANIAELYNRVASIYGRVGPDPFAYAGKGLVERIGINEDARVLDVGVGRGANLFPAAEKVGPHGNVIGIDLSEEMLKETGAEIERRGLRNAFVLPMDAERLWFDDTSFDFVLCGFAIFLFPHFEQALAEFYRVLRAGGTIGMTVRVPGKLGITIASDGALSQWYSKRISEYHEQYHFPLNAGGARLDLAELPTYLESTGFTDVHILQEQTEFIYADAQQWWDAKWTHGTRYSLEHMTPEALARFKAEVFAKLAEEQKPDGIHEEWHLQYIIGTRGV